MNQVELFLTSSDYKLIGVTGNAGAGKSTLTSNLPEDNFLKYSIDWRFVGDSRFRRKLLKEKAKSSLDSYIDACNQFNWWDWDLVLKDLNELKIGRDVEFFAYNRDLGSNQATSLFAKDKKIICEGALLGNEALINQLEIILFVYTPINQRLTRLLKKDSERRSLNEILARFLITEYSENRYYEMLLKNHGENIFFVNDSLEFIPCPKEILSKDFFVPLPV